VRGELFEVSVSFLRSLILGHRLCSDGWDCGLFRAVV